MSKKDNSDFAYKKQHSFLCRSEESKRILDKFPDRLPIIIEKGKNEKNLPNIDKTKYLVPYDLTIGQFIYIVRQRIKTKPEQSIFVLTNGILPSSSQELSRVYSQHKDYDGFLYLQYMGENTFG